MNVSIQLIFYIVCFLRLNDHNMDSNSHVFCYGTS